MSTDRDFSPLDDRLDGVADGFLIDADATDSDQRYLSGFDAPDSFVSLYADGARHLLVSTLEYGRATKEADAASVSRFVEFDHRDRVAEHGSVGGRARTIAAFLDRHDVDSVLVPASFPVGVADGLRAVGVELDADETDVVGEIRATKTADEVEAIREAQSANEAAMTAAEELLREASVDADGRLRDDDGVLTAERVKERIEVTLLHHGCGLDETIVACGADAADPHNRGCGPLHAGAAIIVDIFPRSKETKYHADMTRTFVKGEPADELRRRYDVTDEARQAALAAVEPGVTGGDVHDAVCDVYEEAGYATLRSDPETEVGFIHSTGHGVGLDVHEAPRISPDGEELRPGHVITIEPGLYDPSVGGVRIEDLVVVTEDGYENLTSYPVEFEV
jgi:Xaa-Pro aminopeptidase